MPRSGLLYADEDDASAYPLVRFYNIHGTLSVDSTDKSISGLDTKLQKTMYSPQKQRPC